jgi:hypothetical protein
MSAVLDLSGEQVTVYLPTSSATGADEHFIS